MTARHERHLLLDPSVLAFAGLGGWLGVWSAGLPAIQAHTGVDDTRLGLVLLAADAAMLPVPLLLAPLARRAGGGLLAVCLGGVAVCGLLPVLAGGMGTLALGLMAAFMSIALLDVVMNAAVSAREHREGRHLMQAAHALFPLAVLVVSAIVGLLRRAAVSIVAPFVVVSAVLAGLAVLARIAPPQIAGTATADAGTRRRSWRRLARLAFLGVLAYSVEGSLMSWSAIHTERTLGGGPLLGALAPAVISAASFLGRVAGQRQSHRGQPLLMLIGTAFATGGIVLAATAGTPGAAIAGFAVAGLGIAPWAPAIFSEAGRAAAETADSAATGIVLTFAYGGLCLGPAIVGVVAGAAGLRLGILILAAPAVLIAAAVRRPRPAPLTTAAAA